MSGYNEYDDEYGQNENSGGSLRTLYEQALKDLKVAKDETATLKEQIGKAKASEVLTAKGYNPTIVKFAAADGIDLSDEKAIDKWLADNAEVFKPAATQSDAPADAEVTVADEGPDPAMVTGVESAYSAMSRIHSTASPAVANKYQATLAGLPDDASPEQVLEVMRAAGL